MFIVRTDAEAEAPILWPGDAKNWLNGKDPDAGKDWRPEEKGMTEDEMDWWHHRLNGCEFEWTSGVGDGQGGLVCCSSWGPKESYTTEWLKWTELNWTEQSSDFPYFLPFKSEFGNKEFMISHSQILVFFCWLYRVSTSLAAKNIINLILVLTIWWCPCVVSSLVLEKHVCYDHCILLEKLC